jgi:AraC family transcriptional regulator, regulatory protein of adaptative response / DNA-3-methyladenine glycosylase II
VPKSGDEIRLELRRPIAFDLLLPFLSMRAVAGIEEVRDGIYARSLPSGHGPAVFSLVPDRVEPVVHLTIHVGGEADSDAIVDAARTTFDLDADPAEIDSVLGADPALAPLLARTPGIRMPGSPDRFELLMRAVFGQQVSVANARTQLGAFVARFGTPLAAPVGSITHAFPSSERVAEIAPEELAMPRRRAETVRRLGEAAASGALDLSDRERALAALADMPGIGPWTLDYVAMRGFHDRDAFPASDLGVRRAFESFGLPSTTKKILDRAERWRPYRAYAVMHLWSALANATA